MNHNKNKSKHLAKLSLAIMGAGFVFTIPFQHTWWGKLLQSGFEAGLVGGLADWFAVTALFRHPLGLPIPHTALLPKNRQRISNGIVNMLENEWLTKESISSKMRNMNFTEKALKVLEEKLSTEAFKKTASSFLLHAIRQLDLEKLTPIIEKELKGRLEAVNTLPILQSAAKQISESGYDEKALDFALTEIQNWAEKETTKYQLGTLAIEYIENMKMDGFMQLAIRSFSNFINEEKLGSILQTFVLNNVQSLQEESSRNRQIVLLKVKEELQRTENLGKLSLELNNWKERFLVGWDPSEKITQTLEQFRDKLISLVQDDEFIPNYVLPALNDLINKTRNDSEKMTAIEDWAQKEVAALVEKNHTVIGKLVRENLDKLDDATITMMVENNVGKDLQWIRVNGALCGFLIGFFLFGIKALF